MFSRWTGFPQMSFAVSAGLRPSGLSEASVTKWKGVAFFLRSVFMRLLGLGSSLRWSL